MVDLFNTYVLKTVKQYSQRPKTERSVFRQRRNPNKGLFELAVFGFRSFGPGLYRSVPNYFEQTKVSEIRTDCSDFRHKFTNLHLCLKSKHFVPFELYVFGFQTQICV